MKAHRTHLILIAIVFVLTGCASTPPLMPEAAGKIPAEPRSVRSVPGIYMGGPIYGPCTCALSIDGGGIRGIIPAVILAEIEQRTGKPIANQFNVIAGTSTGAILALGLTRPADGNARVPAFRAEALVDFFKKGGMEVFPDSHSPLRKARQFFHPKYDEKGIDSILEKYFGDVRFMEALVRVYVPAYDIEDMNQIWFDSFDGHKLYMKDVAHGATAAPSYLPPARFAVPLDISKKGYVALVDGGVFANDPGLKALEGAREAASTVIGIGNSNDRSILLVSIGTGTNKKKYTFEQAWGWGSVNWVDPLLEIMFTDSAVERKMKFATNDPEIIYMRLQPDLKNVDIPLDDSSSKAIKDLTEIAQEFIKEHNADIDEIVNLLSLPKSPQCGMRAGGDYERPFGSRQH